MSTIPPPPPPPSKQSSSVADVDEILLEELVHWAHCNGIVMANPPPMEDNDRVENDSSFVKSTEEYISRDITHAPFALEPYPFPGDIFLKVQELAPLFNKLVDKIARDEDWLIENLESTAKSDKFTGKLMSIMKQTRIHGIKQKCYFGIHRSDYMLHAPIESEKETEENNTNVGFLQVELNTIASSFGALSSKLSEMYQSVYLSSRFNIPDNEALEKIVFGMQVAHHEYVNQTGCWDANVLFLVQHNERNFADQRILQHLLHQKYKIRALRATFQNIRDEGTFGDETSGFEFKFRRKEVSVIYFRAGYSPSDYISEEDWDTRLKIELSRSIKCPNIAYHLAGTKKIQQVLCQPAQLERFLDSEDSSSIKKCFAGMYSLADDNTERKKIIDAAMRNPDLFVMKPQREGGGNNLYGQDIANALKTLSADDLSSYVMMDRIKSPTVRNTLVKKGRVLSTNCICEIGIYGIYIGYGELGNDILNRCAGYLLRVKQDNSDEGGVAAGFSCLSSVSLT